MERRLERIWRSAVKQADNVFDTWVLIDKIQIDIDAQIADQAYWVDDIGAHTERNGWDLMLSARR